MQVFLIEAGIVLAALLLCAVALIAASIFLRRAGKPPRPLENWAPTACRYDFNTGSTGQQ